MDESKNLVEKGILASLGFWLLVHEKADDIIRDLIERGKIAPEEGKHFLEDLSKRADDEKEKIKKKINSTANRALQEAGCATKRDVERLNTKLEELEGKIAVLERKKKTSAR